MDRYRIEQTSVRDNSELDYYGQKRYVIIDNVDNCVFSCEHMSYREAMRDVKDLNADNRAFRELKF
jgi:hypothetical protein